VQSLNTTTIASDYAGRDPQGGTSNGSWSHTYFAFFSLHSYIYRVINMIIFLS